MSVSEKEQDECHQAFNYFSRTTKDKLTYDELILALQAVGVLLPAGEKKSTLDDYNARTSSTVDKGLYTYDDFFKLYHKKTHESNTESELKDAFRIFDADGSGAISHEEIKHIFTTLGERMTDEEVEEMIKIADRDHDGNIDYNEFVKMLVDQ